MRPLATSHWPLLLLFATIGYAAAPPAALPEAVPVDGSPFKARLVAVDANWGLTFEGAIENSKPKQMAAGDLCWWGGLSSRAGRRKSCWSMARSSSPTWPTSIRSERVFDWNAGGSVKLPLEIVAGIVFHPPADPQSADALLAKLPTAGGDADRLLLVNGDSIGGELLSLADDTVHIRTAAGELKVRTDKIAAVAIEFRAGRQAASRERTALGWVWPTARGCWFRRWCSTAPNCKRRWPPVRKSRFPPPPILPTVSAPCSR